VRAIDVKINNKNFKKILFKGLVKSVLDFSGVTLISAVCAEILPQKIL
jgi:hypothetical protein